MRVTLNQQYESIILSVFVCMQKLISYPTARPQSENVFSNRYFGVKNEEIIREQ
jgi:hypothetical protein